MDHREKLMSMEKRKAMEEEGKEGWDGPWRKKESTMEGK